jgi:predicted phosphodiesterase
VKIFMKYAFLSDIHGNAVALDAVIRDLETVRPDRMFVLGDLAFRGAEPKRSIALVRSLGCPVIGGNADLWVTRGIRAGEVPEGRLAMMRAERQWTREHLDEDDLFYLKELPDGHAEALNGGAPLLLCHAAPNDRFALLPPNASDEALLTAFRPGANARPDVPGPGPAVAVYGHIHLPFIRFVQGLLLINTGSVGLPFDGLPAASYALLDDERGIWNASIRRVRYNLDAAAEALDRTGYPERDLLVRSLRTGTAP